jgi:hypothetical protein
MPCAPSRAQGPAVQKIAPWGFADLPAAAIEQAGQTGWPEVPVDEMEASEAASVTGRGLMLDEIEHEALEPTFVHHSVMALTPDGSRVAVA